MKKSFLIITVALLALVSVGFWIYSTKGPITGTDGVQLSIILLIGVLAVVFGFRKLKAVKRGEPTEDEMSKQTMQKASSFSFYVSLYWWLVIMYITDNGHHDPEQMFGTGIIGMAVIFVLSWLYFNWRGTSKS